MTLVFVPPVEKIQDPRLVSVASLTLELVRLGKIHHLKMMSYERPETLAAGITGITAPGDIRVFRRCAGRDKFTLKGIYIRRLYLWVLLMLFLWFVDVVFIVLLFRVIKPTQGVSVLIFNFQAMLSNETLLKWSNSGKGSTI